MLGRQFAFVAALSAALAPLSAPAHAENARYTMDATGGKVVEITNLSPSPDCVAARSVGKVVKVRWTRTPETPSFDFKDDKWGASYVNIDLDNIAPKDMPTIEAGLRELLRPGRKLALTVKGCGAAGRVEMLDAVKAR